MKISRLTRLARLGVLLAGVGGLTATTTPPASATTVKTVTFIGNALLLNCGGLGYVGLFGTPSPPGTKTDPKGLPQPTYLSEGNHCDFKFNSDVCEKESVSTPDKELQKNGAAPCFIGATGVVLGWCGWWTGTGTLLIDNLNGNKGLLNNIISDFKFTDVGGGQLYITGGAADFNVRGWALATPTTGSCTNKTATGFTITGELVIKKCTDGSTLDPVCPPV